MSESVRLRKMPALDGLRGVAVAGVLLFHAGHLVGGYLGVDLFFVLSGFLITSLLLSERIRTGRVGLSAFWSRRARRLLPALLAVLAAVAVYAAVWAAPTELAGIRADALATLGYVANWHTIAAGHSYWDLFRSPSPLEHTWSLAIEEQFYLVWPLVVLAMVAIGRRKPARAVLFGASGLAVLSLVRMLLLYAPGGDPQRVYLGTDTRAAALLLGAALGALITERGHPRRRATRVALEVAGLAGAAGLAWAWITVDGQSDGLYQGGLFLCGLAAVAVLAAASAPEAGVLSRALSFAPLRALGVVSYGVYLWHWPVYLVLNRDRVGVGGWPLVIVRIAVSLAFAVVSWLALERPIRYGALPGWRVAAAAPAAAVMLVVAVVLTTAGGHQPALAAASASSTRTKGARAVIPAAPSSTTVPGDAGSGSGAGTPAGEAPAPSPPARVLLVGDSVASSLVDGFSSLESPLGYQLSHDTWPSCTIAEGASAARNPLDGHPADITASCDTRWAEDVTVAQPDLVIVVLSGEAFLDYQVDGSWETPCSVAFSRWVRGNLADDLGVLTSTGAKAVIVLPAHLDLPWVPPDFNTRIDCFASTLRELARATGGATTVDLNRLTCPHDRCVHELDGVTLRPDGYHYDGPASAVTAQWIASQIPALARS
jgi:peptidoglycan/LPS O-acetylase OafA/YrhL